MKAALNDLERVYMATRGPEGYPTLFRKLLESNLVFLIPYHPEFVGTTFQLKNGDPAPKFVVWKSASEGAQIPIFTSIQRANDACKKIGARDAQYAIAEIKGEQLFAILRCQNYPIMINPATGLETMFLDSNAIRMLADGSIFDPMHGGEQKQGTVEIVQPADYPTNFLQPLFQFLRDHAEIKAAWLFREVPAPNPSRVSYVFVLKAHGDAEKVKKDFAVVAKSSCPENTDFGVTLLDPQNAPLVQITSRSPAFYAAPDYKSPSPLEGGN
jgi:hypothetical protein